MHRLLYSLGGQLLEVRGHIRIRSLAGAARFGKLLAVL
jgi:hypothetical protein